MLSAKRRWNLAFLAVSVLAVLLVGLVSGIGPVLANEDGGDPPPGPVTYSGAIIVGGAPAPDGLSVVARIANPVGEDYQSQPRRTQGGKYKNLIVGPTSTRFNYRAVTFHILQGGTNVAQSEPQEVAAAETDTFMPGPGIKDGYNLTFPEITLDGQAININMTPGWNLLALPFQPENPAINTLIPSSYSADIVMAFDNAKQVWLTSRRTATTGLFTGDIPAMKASTAYFIRTSKRESLRIARPSADASRPPPPPLSVPVVKGWNLVPVVSNTMPIPPAVAADAYFSTLGVGGNPGWLKALTLDTRTHGWISVAPGETITVGVNGVNPCTGLPVTAAAVQAGTEPCQVGSYSERSTPAGVFNGEDQVKLKQSVEVGRGYWLYAITSGVIIP